MNTTLKTLLAVLLVGTTLSACGGGGDTTNVVSTTTLGEELADLDKALAEGLLTEEEYEKQREALLDTDR